MLSSLHAESVRVLEHFEVRALDRGTWRRDTNRILEAAFGDPGRPPEVAVKLNALRNAVDADRHEEARRLITELNGMMEGETPTCSSTSRCSRRRARRCRAVRDIAKGHEPATVTETRATTDLSTSVRARNAFNQIDKHAPTQYGRPGRAAYLPRYIQQHAPRLPEMVGVIEAMLR